MSQTQVQEQTTPSSAPRRINFSDDNRALHLQAFFKWLPEEFHETPLVDWTQLPSKIIGYLVNIVGESPFAVSLALAAYVAPFIGVP